MAHESKREKNWKRLYLRSAKLARAQQLGFEYPRFTEAQLAEQGPEPEADERSVIHVLFVCSRNQWRSPTAEQVWRRHPKISARSAGTSPNAKRRITVNDLHWADVIFVMEEKHRSRLLAEYRRILENKPIHVLDIPDQYKYMDPELVEELKHSVGVILDLDQASAAPVER